jgi:CRISPR/Cas system CMR subunit Cmr4 (Cas7 group RAMP superfamily)
MILLLNPLLEGLEAARRAAAENVRHDDEMTVEDQGDHWIFEFTPREDILGGGARVTVSKNDFHIVRLVLTQ